MKSSLRVFNFVGVFCASLLFSGCFNTTSTTTSGTSSSSTGTGTSGSNPLQGKDPAEVQRHMGRLRSMGVAYQSFINSNNRGPTSWEELKAAGGGAALDELQAAGCVVVWSKTFREATNGTSQTMIAHLPDVPQQGGHALMLDGSVKLLTAEDFKTLAEGGTLP